MSKITISAINKAIDAIEKDKKYGTFKKIERIIYKKYKSNKDPAIVALKIAFIDHTNSTNLRMDKTVNIADIANKITIINFDKRVRTGDLNLVNEIANMGNRKLLSFASKYCLYHNHNSYNRDDFCIYDGVVRNALPGLLKEIGIKKTKSELCDYIEYCKAIDLLINVHKLNSLKNPRRDLDSYIWWTYRK